MIASVWQLIWDSRGTLKRLEGNPVPAGMEKYGNISITTYTASSTWFLNKSWQFCTIILNAMMPMDDSSGWHREHALASKIQFQIPLSVHPWFCNSFHLFEKLFDFIHLKGNVLLRVFSLILYKIILFCHPLGARKNPRSGYFLVQM